MQFLSLPFHIFIFKILTFLNLKQREILLPTDSLSKCPQRQGLGLPKARSPGGGRDQGTEPAPAAESGWSPGTPLWLQVAQVAPLLLCGTTL